MFRCARGGDARVSERTGRARRLLTFAQGAVPFVLPAEPPPPAIRCRSVVHGINFGYDSADIRPESEPVLAKLFEELRGDKSASIVIEGHTSGEGTNEYNLSERRAQSVVRDLVRRGLDSRRLTSAGAGEARPIATNDDESGRSMNRRVEVRCK